MGHLRETGINTAFAAVAATPPILCIGREADVVREGRRFRREGAEEKGWLGLYIA